MLTPDNCPFCGSSQVIAGNVHSPKGHGFRPNEVSGGFVLTLRSPWAFHFGHSAQFCPECCMVWSKADTNDAEKFLAKFANEELKARLAGIPIGGKAQS